MAWFGGRACGFDVADAGGNVLEVIFNGCHRRAFTAVAGGFRQIGCRQPPDLCRRGRIPVFRAREIELRALHETRRLRALVSLFRKRIRWEQGDRADELLADVQLFARESPALAQLQARSQQSEDPLAPTIPLNNGADETVQSVSQWLRRRETPGALSQQMIANVLFAAGMRHAAPNLFDAQPYWLLATQHDPNHAAAWSNLAVIAARQERMNEAIVFCERSLAINPQRAVAWRNLRQFAAHRWTRAQLDDLSTRAAAFGIQVDAP